MGAGWGPASMTKPLDQDLRIRIVEAIEGSSCRAAAKRFGVSESAAIKLMQRYRTTGTVAPGKIGGGTEAVSAGLLTQPQSHRSGLLKTQDAAAQGPGANMRRREQRYRRIARKIHR